MIATYVFRTTGRRFVRSYRSLFFFLSFVGHLGHSCKNILTRHLSINWRNIWKTLYYSGVSIIMPLIIITSLMAMSLGMSGYYILSNFQLQEKAISIIQVLSTQDILPLLIGFVLCVQVSLNIINARIKIKHLQQTPQEVILEYILPIIIGLNLTGLLLHMYLINTIYLSLYVVFHNILRIDSSVYLMEMERTSTLMAFINSFIKTLGYCSIVSFTAGYYYYMVATKHIPLRRAVSRILTRGSFWLTVTSVCIKFLNL